MRMRLLAILAAAFLGAFCGNANSQSAAKLLEDSVQQYQAVKHDEKADLAWEIKRVYLLLYRISAC